MMKLHEEAEDQASRNDRMKRQLAQSKLQAQVDEQAKQIKELKAVVLRLNRTVQLLIKKLGP
jgi:hypothetical protein